MPNSIPSNSSVSTTHGTADARGAPGPITGQVGTPAHLDLSLLDDSIHACLNEQDGQTAQNSSVIKLRAILNRALHPLGRPASEAWRTQFTNISGKIDSKERVRFDLHVANQIVTRTQEEIELHILLQSKLRAIDPLSADTGDSIDSESIEREMQLCSGYAPDTLPRTAAVVEEIGAALIDEVERSLPASTDLKDLDSFMTECPLSDAMASTPVRIVNASDDVEPCSLPSGDGASTAPNGIVMPSFTATDVMPVEVRPGVYDVLNLGNKMRRVNAQAVDMQSLCERFHGLSTSSHLIKNISGGNAHCWWRAGMTTALLQKKPETLRELLIMKLGNDFADDTEKLCRMAAAVRSDGPNAMMTGPMGSGDGGPRPEHSNTVQTDILEIESKLKLPNCPDDGEGERVCQRIVDGLLEKAGVKSQERCEAIFGDEMGSEDLLITLLRELDCNTLLLHIDSDFNNIDDQGNVPVDYAEADFRWCENGDLGLANVEYDSSSLVFAKNIADAARTSPFIVFRDSHCSIGIPKQFYGNENPVNARLV